MLQIVFEGVVGRNSLGNIAIDDVSIVPGVCPSKLPTKGHTLAFSIGSFQSRKLLRSVCPSLTNNSFSHPSRQPRHKWPPQVLEIAPLKTTAVGGPIQMLEKP